VIFKNMRVSNAAALYSFPGEVRLIHAASALEAPLARARADARARATRACSLAGPRLTCAQRPRVG